MRSGLGVKTFVFSPSPRTLLAFLHLFAPFFTPNRLKSGALQWGEGRKTKNGCDAYAREAERSPHAFTPFGRFSSPRFHLARGRTSLPRFLGYPPPFDKKRGGVFGSPHGRSAIGGVRGRSPRVLLRKFAPQSARRGAKIITFRWHFRGNPLYLQQNLHRGRRTTPHSHPYEETAVSPSQRRRLLPHHQ